MRTLRFIVEDQILKPDPNCDFSDLVPGTSQHLRLEFIFSHEWKDCVKVVGFYSPLGIEYEPQVLVAGKNCMVPAEACAKRSFKIQVIGKKGDFKLTTNKVTVSQTGG